MMPLPIRRKRPSTSRLRQLSPHPRNEASESSLCILFVPDVQNQASKKWLDESWAPLQRLIPTDLNHYILGFESSLDLDLNTVWNSISYEAKNLVNCLTNQNNLFGGTVSALVFICQGLGGLIAKQALIEIHDLCQLPDRRKIRDIYQGAVLFGTPHPTYEARAEWFRLRLLLRSSLKLSTLSRLEYSRAELEATNVANISRRFKLCINDTQVISIYETRPTKVPRGIFGSETSLVSRPTLAEHQLLPMLAVREANSVYIRCYDQLVDREFAEIGVPLETLIPLNTDHYGLLRSPQFESMLNTIKIFFREALASAKSNEPPMIPPGKVEVNDILAESEWSNIERAEVIKEDQFNTFEVLSSDSDNSRLEAIALTEFAFSQKALPVPYCMLRPGEQNPDFFGREDALRLIEEALLPKDSSITEVIPTRPQAYAICGLGGVGKTELAREYAFSNQHRYDAVFWIEAEQTAQLSEGFAVIASQLGYNDNSDSDRVISRNLALEWLGNPIKRRSPKTASLVDDDLPESDEASWLLVFNNADNLQLLQDFWPVGEKGSILITSRDPMAKRKISGTDLEPFEPREAASFLRRVMELDDSPDMCEMSLALSLRLGGLPLAITQIAALIERLEMTLEEFLQYFDQQTTIEKVAKMKPTILQDHYKHSLFTVWALENLSPRALATLQVLSFLNPDSIKESLVSNKLPSEAPADFPTTHGDYIMARLDLTKSSLIKRNRVRSEVKIHRLVQDVVLAQMTPEITVQTLEFTSRLLLNAWPTGFLRFDHNTATWNISEELLPHIIKVKNLYEKFPEAASSQARHNLAKLLLFAGWYLLERSDFKAAKPFFLIVLGLCGDSSLDLRETRADVLFALSALSAQINEDIQKNLEYAQDHFDCRVDLRDGSQFGEDRIAMAYGELAHIQVLAGKYEDAISNAHIAINMTERSPAFLAGNDWPTFSSTHLAYALAAQGRYDEAMRPLQRTLEYWKPRATDTHLFHLGIVYRCIGFVMKRQASMKQSFEAYLVALKHFKATLNDKSHYVSQMCSNLGVYHAEKKEYETASLYFEQSVKGYREHSCYEAQLALVLYRQGKMQAAMGDILRSNTTIGEAKNLYVKLAKGYNVSSDITMEQLEATLPLTAC